MNWLFWIKMLYFIWLFTIFLNDIIAYNKNKEFCNWTTVSQRKSKKSLLVHLFGLVVRYIRNIRLTHGFWMTCKGPWPLSNLLRLRVPLGWSLVYCYCTTRITNNHIHYKLWLWFYSCQCCIFFVWIKSDDSTKTVLMELNICFKQL